MSAHDFRLKDLGYVGMFDPLSEASRHSKGFEDSLKSVEHSYFHYCLPLRYVYDETLQGKIAAFWERLEVQFNTRTENFLHVCLGGHSGRFFKVVLRFDSRIHSIRQNEEDPSILEIVFSDEIESGAELSLSKGKEEEDQSKTEPQEEGLLGGDELEVPFMPYPEGPQEEFLGEGEEPKRQEVFPPAHGQEEVEIVEGSEISTQEDRPFKLPRLKFPIHIAESEEGNKKGSLHPLTPRLATLAIEDKKTHGTSSPRRWLSPLFHSPRNYESGQVRFVNEEALIATFDYLDKIAEISEKILVIRSSPNKVISVLAWGYDRVFLKQLLFYLYPSIIEAVTPESGSQLGEMHVSLKAGATLSEREHLITNRIRKCVTAPLTRSISAKDVGEKRISLSEERKVKGEGDRQVVLLQPLSGSEKIEHLCGMRLWISIFCYIVRVDLKGRCPKKNTDPRWDEIWQQANRFPLFIRGILAQIDKLLLAINPSMSMSQTLQLANLSGASNFGELFSFFSVLKEILEPEAFEELSQACFYRELGPLNQYVGIDREKIQRLAMFRSRVEAAEWKSVKDISAKSLKKISVYQTARSYFPDHNHSQIPLVSIWINHQRFDPSLTKKPATPRENYFSQLIESLYSLSTGKEIDGLVWAKKIVASEELSGEGKDLLLVLRAGSFSNYFFAHQTVMESIFSRFKAKGYEIKYKKPQENPTLEFFVASGGHFSVIRTGIYQILENGELNRVKGEFVIKWIVSCSGGQWQAKVQIPLIHLNESCSLEECEWIYSKIKHP